MPGVVILEGRGAPSSAYAGNLPPSEVVPGLRERAVWERGLLQPTGAVVRIMGHPASAVRTGQPAILEVIRRFLGGPIRERRPCEPAERIVGHGDGAPEAIDTSGFLTDGVIGRAQ